MSRIKSTPSTPATPAIPPELAKMFAAFMAQAAPQTASAPTGKKLNKGEVRIIACLGTVNYPGANGKAARTAFVHSAETGDAGETMLALHSAQMAPGVHDIPGFWTGFSLMSARKARIWGEAAALVRPAPLQEALDRLK